LSAEVSSLFESLEPTQFALIGPVRQSPLQLLRLPGIVISIPRLIAELIFVSGSTAFIAYAAHLARRTIREAVTLQRTTDQLSRYCSPDIARRIRDGGEAFLKPGGREQDVVVLFSDLEGFTRACAGVEGPMLAQQRRADRV
jgi:class 3 adenylate cyclase